MTMLQQLTQSIEPCEYIQSWNSSMESVRDLVSDFDSTPRNYCARFIVPMDDDEMVEWFPRDLQVIAMWNYYYLSMSWVPTLLSVNSGKHEYHLQQITRMIQ